MSESALVLEPTALEPLIGAWRREHTNDGGRGMPPHVTLVYPFAETAALTGPLLHAVRATVASHPEPRFELRRVAYFGSDENILYLAPEPAEPIIALTTGLVRRFPEYPLYGGVHSDIVPHVTVAHGPLDVLGRSSLSSSPPCRSRSEWPTWRCTSTRTAGACTRNFR